MTNYIPAQLTRLEDQDPIIKIEEDENVEYEQMKQDEFDRIDFENDLYEHSEGLSNG